MNKRRGRIDKDYAGRMALGVIALELIDDCYKGRPSKESKSDFLTKVSLLRDKVSSRC